MTPTIRIDEDVYESLKERAEPFVDTPNSVLRRLLNLDPTDEALDDHVQPEPRSQEPRTTRRQRTVGVMGGRKKALAKKAVPKTRRRAPAGSLLPEERYEVPLLEALLEFGGSAPSTQVVDRVGQKIEGDLTALDAEPLQSGGIRWRSRVQFVRLSLLERGLMEKDAGRGIWAISDAGRKYLENLKEGAA
jgi:hypothetical protein